ASISRAVTARGSSMVDAVAGVVGTVTVVMLPPLSTLISAEVLYSEMRSSHVPSDGHCFVTAKTPGCDVVSRRNGIDLRAPPTSPSAVPTTSRVAGVFSRSVAWTRNAAFFVAGSYGLAGDSIETQGGCFLADGVATAAVTTASVRAMAGTIARRS